MFLFLWMDTYLLFQSNKNILFVEVAVDYTLDIEKHLLFTVTVRVLIILANIIMANSYIIPFQVYQQWP